MFSKFTFLGGQLLITFFIDLLLHPVVWQLFLFCYFVFLIYSYFYFVIIIHLYLLCLFLLHVELLVWALDWAAVKNYLFFNFFFFLSLVCNLHLKCLSDFLSIPSFEKILLTGQTFITFSFKKKQLKLLSANLLLLFDIQIKIIS